MDKKLEFGNLLSELVEIAAGNGNIIDKNTVDNHFASLELESPMFTYIYEYLNSQKISVIGIDSNDDENDILGVPDKLDTPPLEDAFIQMYYDDLNNITPLDNVSEQNLLSDYLTGNVENSKKLIETNMHLVIDIIKDYQGRGVTHGDLIQEGNLGLMEGVFTFNSQDDSTLDNFKQYIRASIYNAIENAINEHISSSRIDDHLAERSNMLDDASRDLAKTLEREPTLEELAKFTSLSENEIHNIMKYSLDALNKN